MAKVYIVGDSTLCKFNDTSYYYPRYGYGVLLADYLNIEVVNLALSGRSAKSFLVEENYKILKNSLAYGDYLIIGFGHNDQKSDDDFRFSSANLPITHPKSFGYVLYEYYIKLAREKGAIPILATPIVRLSMSHNYSGTIIHDTDNGDYRKHIISTGDRYNVTVVDLTIQTNEIYNLRKDAYIFHAVPMAKKVNGVLEADYQTVDKTHINYYGAKLAAYLFTVELDKTENPLRDYIKISSPPSIDDLKPNPNYIYIDYQAPDFSQFKSNESFNTFDGWYGSAFGLSAKNPNSFFKAYYKDNCFYVGEESAEGKINASCDLIAYMFRQISVEYNFKLNATAKILLNGKQKQAGFGVMLRDDAYLNHDGSYNILSNYIGAGYVNQDKNTSCIFTRVGMPNLTKYYQLDGFCDNSDVEYYIERLGQKITVEIKSNNNVYSQSFFDFDLQAKDNKYMYLGFYATKEVFVRFEDVKFEKTGISKGA